MDRLREGDDLALNDLMSRWKEPLVTYCLRYTGNFTDAKEIAQETFVKVYQSRHRYHASEAAFSTWLFQIATNLCRMRHRWKKRHPELLEADREFEGMSPDGVAGNEPSPASQANSSQLADDLEMAIRKLPPKLRIPFLLYELHGMSYREVAKIEGTTGKAVERRLARAREVLRNLLEPMWRND